MGPYRQNTYRDYPNQNNQYARKPYPNRDYYGNNPTNGERQNRGMYAAGANENAIYGNNQYGNNQYGNYNNAQQNECEQSKDLQYSNPDYTNQPQYNAQLPANGDTINEQPRNTQEISDSNDSSTTKRKRQRIIIRKTTAEKVEYKPRKDDSSSEQQ